MSFQTRVTDILNIRHPVIQAPMAGITTPELVAAVSNAGGLGSFGAAYMKPDAIRAAIRTIRALTDRPFAVNLFIPEPYTADPKKIAAMQRHLQPYRDELGLKTPDHVGPYAEDFTAQIAVVLEERVPVFSWTFGIPEPSLIEQLKAQGTVLIATATTVREAVAAEQGGADLIVAQGFEAGGHRGTFLGAHEDALVGTFALIPQVVDAVKVPVIGAGGIMDSRGFVAAFALGAEAVQMGSAFLTCTESGAHPLHKQALLESRDDSTALTKSFSGKPARGVKNRFLTEMAAHAADLPDYPMQNALTRDIRAAASQQGRAEFLSLWGGQAARLGYRGSAADLVTDLIAGAERLVKTFERLTL
jgi:nitronate monooxygenase